MSEQEAIYSSDDIRDEWKEEDNVIDAVKSLPDELPINRGSSKFQGEIQLLNALERPRNGFGKGKDSKGRIQGISNNSIGNERDQSTNYLAMTKSQLEAFRSEGSFEEKQNAVEENMEIATVKVLPRTAAVSSEIVESEILTDLVKRRRQRHDDAIRSYHEKIMALSDALEEKVISTSMKLRESLEDSDVNIGNVITRVSEESVLRMQDYDFVETARIELEDIGDQRKSFIDQFDNEMDGIEEERSMTISAELRALSGELVLIGSMLRNDIAAFVEEEVHQANMVIIGNLRMKNELTAKISKQHVHVVANARETWKTVETRWRELRHERAIDEWKNYLNSENFTDPKNRRERYENFVKVKSQCHNDQRMCNLERLLNLLTPDSNGYLVDLAVAKIEEIRTQANQYDQECTKMIEGLKLDLETMKEHSYTAMKESSETLRRELHLFGARADKGDIFAKGLRSRGIDILERFQSILAEGSLEDLFRKAGGLKVELSRTFEALRNPNLMNNTTLEKVLARIRLLNDSLGIAMIMEREGKAGDLKTLEKIMDELRTAKKMDLPKYVKPFHKKLVQLQSSNIEDTVKDELQVCLELLVEIDPRLGQESLDDDAVSVAPSVAASIAPSVAASVAPSVARSGAIVEHDDKMSRVETVESAYSGRPFPASTLRTVQQRAGSVIFCNKLPEEVIGMVRKLCDILQEQLNINRIVDDEIASTCAALIEQRKLEMETEIEAVIVNESAEKSHLATFANRMLTYYAKIASNLESGYDKDYRTDIDFQSQLDRLLENHQDDLTNLESDLDSTLETLRRAADDDHASNTMKEAVETLDRIERSYRQYSDHGIQIAKSHFDDAKENSRTFKGGCGSLFGLVLSLDNGEAVAALQDTPVESAKTDMASDEAAIVESTEGESKLAKFEFAHENTFVESCAFESQFRLILNYSLEEQEEHVPIADEEPTNAVDGDSDMNEEDEHPNVKEGDLGTDEEGHVVNEAAIVSASETAYMQLQLAPIVVPDNVIASMICSVRDVVLETLSESAFNRQQEMISLRDERCDIFTEELDERLRLHWPRRGRAEVKYFQPRVAELLQHRQKRNRHLASANQRIKAQNEKFEQSLEESEMALRAFRQHMQGLLLHLEAQTSVASLQGILKRGKTTVLEFVETCKTRKDDLMQYVRKSNELLDINSMYLSSCQLFQSGGTYSKEEIECETNVLQELQNRIHSIFEERNQKLQVLFTKIRDTRIEYSKDFQQRYEVCSQNLSVREGLGPKYGAPRRQIQDHMRTQISRSEAGAEYLNKHIRVLESSIEISTPLSIIEILQSVDVLRRGFYRRVKYLGLVQDLADVPKAEILETPISLSENGEDAWVSENEIDLAVNTNMDPQSTFENIVRAHVEECKAFTLRVFEGEGMLEDLQENGKALEPNGPKYPESLLTFLEELETKNTAYVAQASKTLREQMVRARDLLMKIPQSAFLRVRNLSENLVGDFMSQAEAELDVIMKESENNKLVNKSQLKPRLRNPNLESELNALSSQELERSEMLQGELKATYKKILETFKSSGISFEQEILHYAKVLSELYDTFLSEADLQQLPGDEELVQKRMGLRQLRRRRKQQESGDGDVDGEAAQMKTWKGVDVATFKTKINQLHELGEPVDEPVSEVEPELSPAVESKNTPAHRSVFQARNRVYMDFLNWWTEATAQNNAKYEKLLEAEIAWVENWRQSVNGLKTVN